MNKRVSLRDVARMADVSIGTVSNYLNQSAPVSSSTQIRIQRAIDELGYRRNEIARSLRRARTKTLGVIVPNVTNPFYTAIYDGAEEEALRHGYTVTLGITHYNDALLRQYINILCSRQMDGIIIDGYRTYCAEELFDAIDAPIVVIEPPRDFTKRSTVLTDETAAAQEAVEYLIRLGHRRIAIISFSTSDSRFRGYRSTLEKHNIPFDPDLVFEVGHFEPDLMAQGARAMRTLLARTHFSACFITSDISAISALKVIKECGLRVPDDIAIIGFDDIPFAALTDPPLTTVAQSQHEMGRVAVQILLQELSKKRQTEPTHRIIEHQLIIRGST